MASTQIGIISDDGTPVVVKIDEHKFFHQKYYGELYSDVHWVFRIVELTGLHNNLLSIT